MSMRETRPASVKRAALHGGLTPLRSLPNLRAEPSRRPTTRQNHVCRSRNSIPGAPGHGVIGLQIKIGPVLFDPHRCVVQIMKPPLSERQT